MTFDPDAEVLLALFADRAAKQLLGEGWALGCGETADGSSIFLGEFERPVDGEFVATVEFILEAGPVVRGVMLLPTGPVRQRWVRAVVGGEFGVCHVPTRALLRALRGRSEANIALDFAELFKGQQRELPVITDERSAAEAARVLAATADQEAMAFARRHADVDQILQFATSGAQTSRNPEFVGMFVPALLAASDQPAAARDALVRYRELFAHDPDGLDEFDAFADQLDQWLA